MSEILQLKEKPTIQEFAQVKKKDPELYALMAKTRPLLKILVDASVEIMNIPDEVKA